MMSSMNHVRKSERRMDGMHLQVNGMDQLEVNGMHHLEVNGTHHLEANGMHHVCEDGQDSGERTQRRV